jgi:hypothetical protein
MAKNLVQAYKQTPRRKQIQKLGLYVLPVITLGTVFALYLVFSAQAAAAGLEIRSYLDKKEELQRTVANENTQLAWLLSSTNMTKRAEKLGFSQISAANISYMVLPSYPGRSVKLASPVPGSDSVGDVVLNSAYQESLSDFLSNFLFSASNKEVEQ